MLEDRLEALFKKPEEYTILEGSPFKGSTLVGKKYQPLFPYFAHLKLAEPDKGTFRIVRYSVCTCVCLYVHTLCKATSYCGFSFCTCIWLCGVQL